MILFRPDWMEEDDPNWSLGSSACAPLIHYYRSYLEEDRGWFYYNYTDNYCLVILLPDWVLSWCKNTPAQSDLVTQHWQSLGKSCNSSFYQHHDELSLQPVISTDISHSWQSLTFCSFGNLTNCLSRWRRIKIFDNLVSEIHPIIYMLGCGNNTFIVQTNCHFYLFFKEFLWDVFTVFKIIFTFRILSSFWQK